MSATNEVPETGVWVSAEVASEIFRPLVAALRRARFNGAMVSHETFSTIEAIRALGLAYLTHASKRSPASREVL
jgi:hypothetical protein